MQELDLHDMWFQQDGATCHTARVTREHFISRSGLVNWPPRSCYLTPLDHFLWGYVYTDKPALIDALKDNIEAFISEIPAEMLAENWTKRMDHLKRRCGQYLTKNIVLKCRFQNVFIQINTW